MVTGGWKLAPTQCAGWVVDPLSAVVSPEKVRMISPSKCGKILALPIVVFMSVSAQLT